MGIDLSLHEHQELVQRSAHELFRKRCTPEVVRDIEAGRVGYQRASRAVLGLARDGSLLAVPGMRVAPTAG